MGKERFLYQPEPHSKSWSKSIKHNFALNVFLYLYIWMCIWSPPFSDSASKTSSAGCCDPGTDCCAQVLFWNNWHLKICPMIWNRADFANMTPTICLNPGDLLYRGHEVLPQQRLLPKKGHCTQQSYHFTGIYKALAAGPLHWLSPLCPSGAQEAGYRLKCSWLTNESFPRVFYMLRFSNVQGGGLQLPGRDGLLQAGKLLWAGKMWVFSFHQLFSFWR